MNEDDVFFITTLVIQHCVYLSKIQIEIQHMLSGAQVFLRQPHVPPPLHLRPHGLRPQRLQRPGKQRKHAQWENVLKLMNE